MFVVVDSGHERSHIVEDVFPALHSHSKSLGLQFYAVDMYAALPSHLCCPTNGVRTESGGPKDDKEAEEDGTLYHLERMGVLRLAPKEIKLCQQLSAGPNFVVSVLQYSLYCASVLCRKPVLFSHFDC